MYRTYRVEFGDTIHSIANKFGTTKEILKQINGNNIEKMIEPNNYIIVPNNERELFQVYKIKKGDNLYNLAKQFNVSLKSLTELNGLDENDYLYVDQEILIPREGVDVYITEQGDTVDKILKKTGKTMDELLEYNESVYVQPNQMLIYKKEKSM
ncbi:MAG TPA: LysM peptidoglycan-binding domain-containing protein [Tenericutes bacterium]|nr:LysM peptidoglycan-binding domain-containing protein [Mycoplasmatota bacterium]